MEPRMGIRYTSQMPVCANFFWNIWIRSRKILLEEVQGVRKEEEDLKPPWLRQLYKTIINVNGIYLLWSGSYKTDCPCFFPLESTRGMMLITKIKSPPVL